MTSTVAYCQTLLRWLEAGVPHDAGEVPTITALEVFPRKVVLEGEGAAQQFIARAVYADGTDRDVTSLAMFLTNNDNSAGISADGLVTAANRGEAFVMARFATKTVGSQVLVLPKGLQYSPPATQPVNYVDELVNAKLEKLRILPSELCSDEVFLRRATIDIAGHAANGGRIPANSSPTPIPRSGPGWSIDCLSARSSRRSGP